MSILKEFGDTSERLIAFTFITGEVGCPSEKNAQNFVDNFIKMINGGNLNMHENLRKTLTNMVKNGDAVLTGNGISFYEGIDDHWNDNQLLNYIHKINSKPIEGSEKVELVSEVVYDEPIEKAPTEKIFDCSEFIKSILEDKKEAEEIPEVLDISLLKHKFAFRIKSKQSGQNTYCGEIVYYPDTKKVIIKAGTAIQHTARAGRYDPVTDRKNALVSNGTIVNGIFKRDATIDSFNMAMYLITQGVYDGNSLCVKGHEIISLNDLLEISRNEPDYLECLADDFRKG